MALAFHSLHYEIVGYKIPIQTALPAYLKDDSENNVTQRQDVFPLHAEVCSVVMCSFGGCPDVIQ